MADIKNLSGLKELAAALRELGPRVARNTLRRAVSSGARLIRDEARIKAPVDTGEMRKDIMIKRERAAKDVMSARYSVFVLSGKKSRLAGKRRNVDKDSFYWKFVELGTSKMSARPFLRPAYEVKKEDAVKTIGDVIDAGIKKAAQELAKK